MQRVLAKQGSIYLHCDDTASHYLKLLMDAIFGQGMFRSQIIWKRNSSHNDSKSWGRICDVLLFYGQPIDREAVRVPLDEGHKAKSYRYQDERGTFMPDNISAKGLTGGGYFYDFYGHPGPWRYPEDRIRQLDADGMIYLPAKPGGVPRLKRYLTDKGQVPPNLWVDVNKLENPAVTPERLGYPTQKPLALLDRIIKASSPPGGVVLDPFCGCGTSIHAAEALGRHWIGIDISRFAVGLIRNRVVNAFDGLTIDDVPVRGVPVNIEDATALARRNKLEFEKWVCGEIGAEGLFRDPGTPGPDGGVDGVLPFVPIRFGKTIKPEWAVIQVKGGTVTPDSVKALEATVNRLPNVTAGVFVCFNRYMQTVENQRSKARFEDDMGSYPVIQGYSIEDVLKHKPLDLPPHRGVARRIPQIQVGSYQPGLVKN